jgi:hypothetical protein
MHYYSVYMIQKHTLGHTPAGFNSISPFSRVIPRLNTANLVTPHGAPGLTCLAA